MFVIAEIGCNHKGSLGIAKEMVETAARFCKVDAVKFQKRNVKKCLTEEQYNASHPNPANSYGETYGKHRETLELTRWEHCELKELCNKLNLQYGSSVWDTDSLEVMLDIEADFIKIPSAKNNDWGLMVRACYEVKQPLHISLGMTTREEEDMIKGYVLKRGSEGLKTVIYGCTSGYPVDFEDVCLGELPRLSKKFPCEIGYSGHHLGVAVDIAAMVMGARYIERHFTLDRTWKGTDHAASLEPDGMRKLVRDLSNTYRSLGNKPSGGFLSVEAEQRRKLKC